MIPVAIPRDQRRGAKSVTFWVRAKDGTTRRGWSRSIKRLQKFLSIFKSVRLPISADRLCLIVYATQTSRSANATSRSTPLAACSTRRAGTASRQSESRTRLQSDAGATSCSTRSAASAGTPSPLLKRASEVRLPLSPASPRGSLPSCPQFQSNKADGCVFPFVCSDRTGHLPGTPRTRAAQRRDLWR